MSVLEAYNFVKRFYGSRAQKLSLSYNVGPKFSDLQWLAFNFNQVVRHYKIHPANLEMKKKLEIKGLKTPHSGQVRTLHLSNFYKYKRN